MQFAEGQLKAIYNRTSGYCHLCGKKLARSNYGLIGERGAWEVEHSHPRAKGGTDRLNNLYAACIDCNRSKGVKGTRLVRARNGRTCAPLSREKRARAKIKNAITYGVGAAAVAHILCPPAALLAGLVGAHVGHKKNPDR